MRKTTIANGDEMEQIPTGTEEPLHAEEMHDIITVPPAWLIRWGTGSFLGVLLVVLFASVFIRYPDTIQNPVMISSNNGFKSIIAHTSGQVTTILVKPNQLVNRLQPLAYIESSTDNEQALFLLSNLLTMRDALFHDIKFSDKFLNDVNIIQLGDLQGNFQSFYLSYMANKKFIQNKSWSLLPNFFENLDKLISDIQQWKKKYVLTASQSGIVHFVSPLKPLQMVNANQEIFYINTADDKYFGEMLVPPTIVGKLKTSQKVTVKINQLPYQKYGTIVGEISNIGEFPLNNGTYASKIDFVSIDKRLIHSNNLRAGMSASAEIVTEDISLFTRLTNGLYKKGLSKF